MRCVIRLIILVCSLCLLPALLWAQQERRIRITEIRMEKNANSIRLHVMADGPLQPQNLRGMSRRNSPTPTRRITIRLPNTELCISPYFDIGIVPISNLECTVAPTIPPSIDLSIVAYRDVYFTVFNARDFSSSAPSDASQVMITNNNPQELLIQVTINRTNSSGVLPPPLATPHFDISGTGDKLSLSCINTDLPQVVSRLSQFTGVPILLTENVAPLVTAHLENMSLEQILNIFASGYGLSVFCDGDSYSLTTFVPREPSSYANANELIIQLKYLTPDKCLSLLPDPVMPLVHPNVDTNSITACGSAAMLNKIASDIAVIDQPSYHCRVQAWTVSTKGSSEQVREISRILFGKNTYLDITRPGQLSISVDSRQPEELLLALKAFTNTRNSTIKALPAIQVLSGKPASLFVGQDIPTKLNQYDVSQLITIKAGTRLDITPQTANEWITLSTYIENTYLQEVNALGPLLQKQTLNSTLRLRSGETVVVGGLRMNAFNNQDESLPFHPLKATANNYRSQETLATWVLLSAASSVAPINQILKQSEEPE